MKSFPLVIGLCLLLSTPKLKGQSQTIESDVRTYFNLLSSQKIEEALDMVHPQLLAMLGKETFVAQYRQMFNTPGMSMSMDEFKINSISPVFNHSEHEYALVSYALVMTFKVDLSNDKEGQLKSLLLSNYQKQFGKENVKFQQPDSYRIAIKREMFAVNAKDYSTWKVLDFEEGMKVIISTFIPDAVFTHFKK